MSIIRRRSIRNS